MAQDIRRIIHHESIWFMSNTLALETRSAILRAGIIIGTEVVTNLLNLNRRLREGEHKKIETALLELRALKSMRKNSI